MRSNMPRNTVPDVEFSAEDASRSDLDYLAQVVEAVIAAGANVVNLPDTVGYAVPEDFGLFYPHHYGTGSQYRPDHNKCTLP